MQGQHSEQAKFFPRRGKMEKVGRFSVLQLPVEEIVTLRGPKGEAGRLRLNLKLFQFDPTLLWEPPRAFTEVRHALLCCGSHNRIE